MKALKNSSIVGFGSYLPKRIVTNAKLVESLDTSDEWIRTRTGITQRHIVAEGELTSDMAYEAAKAAITDAEINLEAIDLIIVGTTTPDLTFPATAVRVQKKLGIRHGAAFDVQAVCSGFIYALTLANSMIASGLARNAIIIGADSMSKTVDWSDRKTCVLFGDGAGAVVVSASKEQGILGSQIFSDGTYEPYLYTTGGTATNRATGCLKMEGKEVFKHAVEKMSDSIKSLLNELNVEISEVDYFVPHQANSRILEAVAKRLNVSIDKFALTVDKHANTSAATIPLALDVKIKDGTIKKGDLVMLCALGAGFTWGSCLFKNILD
jgi:3-oxoacyl-[acyl-carrier-protein] synthase III